MSWYRKIVAQMGIGQPGGQGASGVQTGDNPKGVPATPEVPTSDNDNQDQQNQNANIQSQYAAQRASYNQQFNNHVHTYSNDNANIAPNEYLTNIAQVAYGFLTEFGNIISPYLDGAQSEMANNAMQEYQNNFESFMSSFEPQSPNLMPATIIQYTKGYFSNLLSSLDDAVYGMEDIQEGGNV